MCYSVCRQERSWQRVVIVLLMLTSCCMTNTIRSPSVQHPINPYTGNHGNIQCSVVRVVITASLIAGVSLMSSAHSVRPAIHLTTKALCVLCQVGVVRASFFHWHMIVNQLFYYPFLDFNPSLLQVSEVGRDCIGLHISLSQFH